METLIALAVLIAFAVAVRYFWKKEQRTPRESDLRAQLRQVKHRTEEQQTKVRHAEQRTEKQQVKKSRSKSCIPANGPRSNGPKSCRGCTACCKKSSEPKSREPLLRLRTQGIKALQVLESKSGALKQT